MRQCSHCFVLFLLLLVCTLPTGTESKMSRRSALLQSLLDDYGPPSLRPVHNHTTKITVQFRLLVTQVIELNEKDQTIQISGWLGQEWQDEFLIWDPAEHDNVTRLFVHTSKIWVPDTTLYKNVATNFESFKDVNAKVTNTGLVNWSTPVILKCTCNINARRYPFDVQVCELKFSAWAYEGSEVNIIQTSGAVSVQNQFRDDSVWELIKVEVVRNEVLYPCCTFPFPDLTYYIHLRRRALFHVLNIIIPCLLLSVLNLMVFVLPPESGEKIQLGMTNLLALVLFQQLINDNLPPTSADKSPIIGFYFTPMIVLACTSVPCTVVVLKLFYHNDRRPVPRWLCVTTVKLSRAVFYKLKRRHPYETTSGVGGASQQRQRESASCDDSGHSEAVSKTDGLSNGNARCRACTAGHSFTERSPDNDTAVNINRGGTVTSSDTHDDDKMTHLGDTCLDWKDVAMVTDRVALVLSAFISIIALTFTVVLFLLE